jgi:Zn-dependent oligopeptidase
LIQEKYRANVMKDRKAWSYEIEDDIFIKNLPSDILEITRKRAEEQ